MEFRRAYEDFSVQDVVDTIVVLLKKNGSHIDEKSFTWTLVGALFDNEIFSKEDFESTYYSLINHKSNDSNGSNHNNT